MIEFKGYLTGSAKKGFIRKTRKFGLIGLSITVPLVLPIIFFFGNALLHDPAFTYAMLGALLVLFVFPFIPKGKKELSATLPKRIYIDGEFIVCVAERYTDSKFISDVKKVVDHGEYYELCFPFGKVSEKFFCQKDLLKRGSLREFEALFKGKIQQGKEASKKKGGSD